MSDLTSVDRITSTPVADRSALPCRGLTTTLSTPRTVTEVRQGPQRLRILAHGAADLLAGVESLVASLRSVWEPPATTQNTGSNDQPRRRSRQ